jgi:alkylhydroperoxidase family enzyme
VRTESPTFLGLAPESAEARALLEQDRESDGYVGNLTLLWCWRPDVHGLFAGLRRALTGDSSLSARELAVLVSAAAAARGDSYCSLAWGSRLAGLSDEATATGVLSGRSTPALSEREEALAAWARQVVGDPNGTTRHDVERLRAAGLYDREIFEATAFVAFRLAFSTVNDALGVAPDKQLADEAPDAIRAAVTWGRPASETASPVR